MKYLAFGVSRRAAVKSSFKISAIDDVDEAVQIYEESRIDTLFGIDICHVYFEDGDGNQLARTDAKWFGKINPY